MTTTIRGFNLASWGALAFSLLLLAGPVRADFEQGGPGTESPTAFERTPPRLALADGEVSFWRPGAEDWGPAPVNMALAPGDTFWAGADSSLEIQIGGHAFVRAGAQTELALMTQEPDYLQFRVGSGTASLDLRQLPAGHTVEIATPGGAFSIERPGYYRVDVEDDVTKLTSRRGGLATLTPARGPALEVAPSEQVVVTAGPEGPQIESYAAPELDAWDNWNYRRTDRQLEALSARYVNGDVYGLSDLDQYGSWRRVASYGPVWIPASVPVGWAPYTYGRWLHDPYYGWTWVDDAAWGWAPFHYGRWVRVGSYWAWAPGPVVVRSVYAPALVAFFGSPLLSVRISTFSPSVAWVALGWGEPCVPWWGQAHWRAQPRWLGWAGPRVVNKVVIRKQTVVHVKDIHVYENVGAPRAFHAVARKDFGRRPVHEARVDARPDRFERLDRELPEVTHARSTSDAGRGHRPPEHVLERRVVATRAARGAEPVKAVRSRPHRDGSPEPLVVAAPGRRSRPDEAVPRPPFATRAGAERNAPKAPPRFQTGKRSSPKEPKSKAPELAQKERAPKPRADASPPPPPARRVAGREPATPKGRVTQQARAETPEPQVRPGAGRSESPPRAESPAQTGHTARGRAKGEPSRTARGSQPPQRASASPAPSGELPGEPVNRVYPGRRERQKAGEPPSAGAGSPSRSEASQSQSKSQSRGRARSASPSQREARGAARSRSKAAPADRADDPGGERR